MNSGSRGDSMGEGPVTETGKETANESAEFSARERLRLIGKKYGPAALSALLLTFAFPPFNVFLLVLVALAPWIAYLRTADAREARRSGFVFGLVFFASQMWFLVPFVQEWTGSYLVALVPYLLCLPIAACYFLLAGWGMQSAYKLGWLWAAPLAWAATEGMRAYMYAIAFPWGLVATPLWRVPAFVQHASLGTIFLVSAWVIAINLIVAELLLIPKGTKAADSPYARQVFRIGMVCALLLAISGARFYVRSETRDVTVGVAQPGVDLAFGDPEQRERDLEEALVNLHANAVSRGVDLTVFPEDVSRTVAFDLPPNSALGPSPVGPVVFGGKRGVGDDIYQTAFAYDGAWSYADKTRLVIYGEYVPFRDSIPFLERLNLPDGDLTPSPELSSLDVASVRIGPMICYEGLFPDLAERHGRDEVQLLAVMSIDDWYAGTAAFDQLWMATVWRSIESGLPLVRSASTGVSLITDQRGQVTRVAEVGEMSLLVQQIGVPERSDAFSHRFIFVWLSWGLLALVLGQSVLSGRREPTA